MTHKSVIGGGRAADVEKVGLDSLAAHEMNTAFWNTVGSDLLGATSLPRWGAFLSEKNLHLLDGADGVRKKRVLEIGCGNGRSLKYAAEKGAAELWGMDISSMQLERTKEYLDSCGEEAKLVCSPMENDCGIPEGYFDIVYSVYAIGWTTDLDETFRQINSYLRKGGIFIFSWSHPIHKCVSQEEGKFVFSNSYFDESWYSVPMGDENFMLSNRKMSTYINALARNGFLTEQLIEENDDGLFLEDCDSPFGKKAEMLPVTFVIEARKL